ncbi:MAG: SxtJ family membrane protein [Planctomycetota bacterium]
MALIQRNREPTPYELRMFGLLLAVFFGLTGAVVLWRAGSWRIATVCWTTATLLAIVYYCVPSVKRPMYMVWMAVMYPIGWIITHVLLALVYYGWITPIGLLIRLFGYDPMRRRLDRTAKSNWIRRKPIKNVDRYFRQY